MNLIKFDAFKNEFPALTETLTKRNGDPRDPKDCDGIKVSRIDGDLLKRTPKHYSWDGSLVGINQLDRVDFVLADGAVMIDAVLPDGEHGSNYAHSETHYSEGETVLEAIYRQGVADALDYIVWTEVGYNVVEHYSEPNFSVTVYKAAKDFPLAEAIAQAQTQAETEVRTESDF